jgi:RHS repeat-associated protein
MKCFSLVLAILLLSLLSITAQAQSNQPPVAGADSYTVHGAMAVGSLYANDSDPDGDALQDGGIVSYPAHGTISGVSNGYKFYTPNYGYFGSDTFSYSVCDSQSQCATGTVTITVSNGAPVASGESYVVRGSVTTARLLSNDSDPDGDTLQLGSLYLEEMAAYPAHGTVYGTYISDVKQYVPHYGYVGPDSFTYNVCDSLGRCTQATVNLFIFASDGLDNAGPTSCNMSVGEPINVATGNMWLVQNDYQLPGAGPFIRISRTYNSTSQQVGLFGHGWSTDYDESVELFDSNNLRLILGSGQAVYFNRSGSGSFAPVQTDFSGSMEQNTDGTFTLTHKEGSVHRFSSAGKLLSITDRNNVQTVLQYVSGVLASVTDASGRVLTVTTNGSGRVTSLSDSMGNIANYTYGASQQLLTAEFPDGSKFQFTYGSSANGPVITSVTDALNNVLEAHTYDGQGRAITSERHGGVEKVTLSYASATRTDVTDALGRVTKYYFEPTKGRSLVTKIEGSCGCGGGTVAQTWAYDNQLNLTSKTNGLGETTSYTYDAAGNPLTVTNALGTTTFTYNGYGQMLTATDSLGLIVTNTYDVKGNLLTTKDALNNETALSWDSRGLLQSVTDARSKVTSFTYNTNGNLTQKMDAANSATAFTYDARGRLATITDPLNNTKSFEYDAAGRINKIIAPDTTFVTFTYDLAGRKTTFTDARNNATNYGYDTASRLTSVTNADNKVTSFTYDLMSNLTGKTDALSRTTNYEYDNFNRLVKVIYPPAVSGVPRLEEQVTYDAGGRVTGRTNQAGQTTAYEYDAGNRLIKITDPLLKVTQYEYNARSYATAIIDDLNQRTSFTVNGVGNVTLISRNSLSRSFVYDAVGNRTSQTDYNNQTVTYTYDNLNRLSGVTYPNSTSASYTYNKLSRLLTATNTEGTVSFSYDSLGRISSSTDVYGYITTYAYDAGGNRTQVGVGTVPNVAPVAPAATYTYDVLNRPTGVTDGAVTASYGYNAVNKLISRTLPNGVTTTYQYNDLDRLTRLTDAKGAMVIADQQYQQDAAGRITQKVDLVGTNTYGYDAAGRLTSATHPTLPAESYTYDGVGNRTASHRSTSYSYQPFNRLQTTSAASYTYDNNGNLLSKTDGAGTTSFTWDYENRLTGVIPPSGSSLTYKYDALGRRIERGTSAGAWTRFAYDGQEVTRDRNSDSTTVEYLNGPGTDQKLRQTGTAGVLYYSTDHLGSTTALTDVLGSVVEQIDSDSFGDGAGSTRTRYGFTGRERDAATGLYYYRARWYDPQQGRFLSEDPIGFKAGVNFYAYVGNNPINRIDPSGLNDAPYFYSSPDAPGQSIYDAVRNIPVERECACPSDNSDVSRMLTGFRAGVDEMTLNGHRYPGSGTLDGVWNNFISYGAGYYGCRVQASYLKAKLEEPPYFPYSDQWSFTEESSFLIPFHYWIVARPSNPQSPIIELDPWRDRVTCKCRN